MMRLHGENVSTDRARVHALDAWGAAMTRRPPDGGHLGWPQWTRNIGDDAGR